MEDGHTLFDYSVVQNDIVQVMIRSPNLCPSKDETEKSDTGSSGYESAGSNNEIEEPQSDSKSENEPTKDEPVKKPNIIEDEVSQSNFYKVGDIVDVKDSGSWYEARIRQITKRRRETETLDPQTSNDTGSNEDGYKLFIIFDGYDADTPALTLFEDIRPRARTKISLSDIKEDDVVMVNYNIDSPLEKGNWYDIKVSKIIATRTQKEIVGSIFLCENSTTTLSDCRIKFVDQVYKIETPVKVSERSSELDDLMQNVVPEKRMYKPNCNTCSDNNRRKCKDCGCSVCGGKNESDKQIMCDECDSAYHIWCLKPALEKIPDDDEWFCPSCKVDSSEVVRAGEKLKESKKKSKMASAQPASGRDWGKGMACAGRTKQCSIVPANYFGPIPGVEVGTLWKFRVQVSEAGIHRPHVAGISGRSQEGSYSIVLSGGYEDDLDDGEEFLYTGSGGRDLSGNKRTAEQSYNQELTKLNRAIALNCAAPINDKVGAEAKDWKKGKPIRVVRNYKARKHSIYAPEDGNRYDGIYKVMKYWPEKGKSGFIVWRYKLKRDDPTPGPWTKAGKERIKKLGLTMQYPDGYLDENGEKSLSEKKSSKKSEKRKGVDEGDETQAEKKSRTEETLELDADIKELIDQDKLNCKLWKECLESEKQGKQFVATVEEQFMCICCQDIVFKPITTVCKHNICQPCLDRSFKADVYTCPFCRHELSKSCSTAINATLRKILQRLLPGYENGRS